MPLAITSYEFSLFLHITAVMVGFGSTFAEAVLFPVAMKMGTRNLPYVHRLQLTINQFFALPALVIVLATGIYQVEEGNWDWGDFWIQGTLGIILILALLNLFFFIPTDRKLLPMVQAAIADAGSGEIKLEDLPAEYQRKGRLEGILGAFTGILLIVAVYLMTTKPGL